jgi:geranylgeranyl diphosphate synthase type II
MIHDFKKYLDAKRVSLEDYLRSSLGRIELCPLRLRQTIEYGLLAPGKRIRPLLVLLATEAGGATQRQGLPAAAAVEMIHAYSLIHDDLPAMDNDDMRRGQPTCHKQFGEALAILAGDALLTLAFQVLAEEYPPVTASVCCRELARSAGAAGMVGGQAEDLECEMNHNRRETATTLPADVTTLERIHARKTGALFRACLRLGVFAAHGEIPGGPDPAFLECLDAYGRCLGQAFQITDDLLDVEGTLEQTGKRVQKDAAHGKLTYPSFLGTDESRRRAEALFQEARDHAQTLGPRGARLVDLTRLLLERTR